MSNSVRENGKSAGGSERLQLHPFPETYQLHEERVAAKKQREVELGPNVFDDFNRVSERTDARVMHRVVVAALRGKQGDPRYRVKEVYDAVHKVADITAGVDPEHGRHPLGFLGIREEAWAVAADAYPKHFSEFAGKDRRQSTLEVMAAASALVAGVEYKPETIDAALQQVPEIPMAPPEAPALTLVASIGPLAVAAA